MVGLKHEIILTAKFSQSTVAGNFQRCKFCKFASRHLRRKHLFLWNKHATLLTFNVYVPHANLTKQRSNVCMFMASIMTSSIYTLVHFSFARKPADLKNHKNLHPLKIFHYIVWWKEFCVYALCMYMDT